MDKFTRSQLRQALAHVGCCIEGERICEPEYLDKVDQAARWIDLPRLGETVYLTIPMTGLNKRTREDFKLEPGAEMKIAGMQDLGGNYGTAYLLRGVEGTPHRDIQVTAYDTHFTVP